MDQGECARCGRKVKSEDNYLKAHLLAGTAVLHWPCLVALLKERGDMVVEGTTCKTDRVSSVRKQMPACRHRSRLGTQVEE